jgi:2-phosphosulfolactate phosphatase
MVAELQTDDPSPADGASWSSQHGCAYRFDWGPNGLRALAPVADVVVIVDVLRFTTAVSAAIESGCTVFPYRWADDQAPVYAAANSAVLAGRRGHGELSLSPTDLLALSSPVRLVLPSPNGSALSFAAREHGARHVLAGCLRNATATARAARRLAGPGGVISIIAAGERWRGATGPLRPAVEDLLGAGAILAALDPAAAVSAPCCSPEAAAARAAFVAARPRLHEAIANCASGRELVGRGWDDDVAASAALDVTDLAARLVDDAFVRA